MSQGEISAASEGAGWDVGDEDLDIPEELLTPAGPGGNTDGEGYYAPPTRGRSLRSLWPDNSQLPADHIAAGSFETAFRYLILSSASFFSFVIFT